jgi:hypothetical protein
MQYINQGPTSMQFKRGLIRALRRFQVPSKTKKQARAMRAAAAGKSKIGIPKKVGKKFVRADKKRGKKK